MSLESRRTALQADLESIPGIKKVYFQPPSNVTIQYPCIIYSFDDMRNVTAANKDYLERDKYTVALLTKDPFPNEMLSLIKNIPYSSFDRQYSSDNIHHFVYTIHLQERT